MTKVAPEDKTPDLEASNSTPGDGDLKVVNIDGSDAMDDSTSLTAAANSIDSTAEGDNSVVLAQPQGDNSNAPPQLPLDGGRLRTPSGAHTPGGSARPLSPLAPSTPLHLAVPEDEAAAKAAKEEESLTDRLEKLRTVAFVRVTQASKSVLASVRAVKCQTRDYILYKVDAWLTAYVPHGVRYFVFFSVAQIFPILYSFLRVDNIIETKCDLALEIYVVGTGWLSFCRIVTAGCQLHRMILRHWEGQTFGEALAQVWNNAENQDTPSEGPCGGTTLNTFIVFFNVLDIMWWFFGFVIICASDPLVCSDKSTLDTGLIVGYQALNVCFYSLYLDFILAYFSLEFDAEVELEKAAKETSADKKRKLKAKVLRKQMAQKDADEKAKKAASRPKVLQVQGKGSGGKKGGVDEGWFMDADEGGVPPRKRALAILTEQKDDDSGSGGAPV